MRQIFEMFTTGGSLDNMYGTGLILFCVVWVGSYMTGG